MGIAIRRQPVTATQYIEEQKTKMQEEKDRILASPEPTEKFNMIISPGIPKRIKIFDGAQKLRGDFPMAPHLSKLFMGRMKITVKAKIIDGQFELIKVMPV